MKCRNCRTKYELAEATEYDGDDEFCSSDCRGEFEEDFDYLPGNDDDLIDGVGFARPGENSALRAATASNPRNLPCPSCGAANRLTPIDVSRGYQCDSCADMAERGGY